MSDKAEAANTVRAHSNLPVLVGRPVPRQRLATPNAGAEFISQLLAERDRLQPQRARRRASMATALDCYDAAAVQAVRRMPPGYRKSVLA